MLYIVHMIEQVNLNQQGMLAKLLAKEDLRIQHGNYSTAFFDTKSRTLGLPIWKTSGKNVYDLLVGHEVGHALFTPAEGIEKFRRELPEVPFDICNIVEDVRIERMVQDLYPGLASVFRQAYEQMVADNFFGTNGKDIAKLNFADRLNIHAKAGKAINVPLSPEELAIYNRCLAAQNFDEVIEICKDIAHLVGKRKNEQSQNEQASPQAQQDDNAPQMPSAEQSQDSDESGDSDLSSDQDDSSSDKEDESKDSDSSSSSEIKEDSTSKSEDSSSTSASEIGNTELKDELTSQTAAAFNDAVKQLQQIDHKFTYFSAPSKQTIHEIIVPYATLLEARKNRPQYSRYMTAPETQKHYIESKTHARKYVNGLIREFEMRKSAHQYSRATVAKTGTLNMSKLHSYRYSEDIFKSITKLANAKDHGMMLFVDYSSSMNWSIGYVLEHTVNLVMFCRAAGIPFQVYGFTNPAVYAAPREIPPAHNEINVNFLSLIETFSSKMSKAEFDLAIEQTLAQAFFYKGPGRTVHHSLSITSCQASSKYETLSGTPLNECVVAAHTLVKEFRAANRVQKMNIVFLTDGDGGELGRHQTSIGSAHDDGGRRGCYTARGVLNGRQVEIGNDQFTFEKLIVNLRKTTDSTVIGFFIPNSPNHAALRAQASLRYIRKDMSVNYVALKKQHKDDGVIIMKDGYGYDEFYILSCGKDLAIEDEDEFDTDFEVVDVKKVQGKLARAFTEFNENKRMQRVVLSKFSQTIA